jgi:fumarate reductase flavoprotein subunit
MQYVVPYLGGMEDPKQPGRTDWGWIVSRIYRMLKGELWVDRSGRRFINEDTDSADARERALREIHNVCYILFNEAQLQAGGEKLVSRITKQMQAGNSIFKADSIEALAAASGIDAAGLTKTLAAYNQNAKQGKDPQHNRTDIVPIETGPYYAIKTTGVLFTTMGGVRTNVNLQAVDGDGRVIPGLYAVGEVMGMGQTMGDGLCGGFGNGVCITFGRLAARHAVAQARVCAV